MARDLPSIASLQAFVQAAETLSFKQAARALNLSPSALSRQVQALETHLGVALFRRLNPGLELTPAGARYLGSVRAALAALEQAERLVAPGADGPLRVSALESFSAKWLVPHLPEFEARHPSIGIELEATLRYADFARDRVDVAIRFGTGPWEDLHGEPIVDLDIQPICSPALLRGQPGLAGPDDLPLHPWIHVTQVPEAWSIWLEAVGLSELRGARDLHFDHVGIALSAAESGQGVALSTALLCGPELASGRLCQPFDRPVRSPSTYHLVCRPEELGDPRIQAFRDWLVDALAAAPR